MGQGPRCNQMVTPELAYQANLIARSLDVLGRKWTLLVLRDIGFLGLDRFGQIIANNHGLSPRMLSKRLRELARDGLVERIETGGHPRYRATDKGEDALFVLFALLRYGLRNCVQPDDAPLAQSQSRPGPSSESRSGGSRQAWPDTGSGGLNRAETTTP